MSVIRRSGTDVVSLLADPNISYLAFVNQFFKLFPCRVGVISQRFVDDDFSFFLIRFFLECDRPEIQLSTLETAASECSGHQ